MQRQCAEGLDTHANGAVDQERYIMHSTDIFATSSIIFCSMRSHELWHG